MANVALVVLDTVRKDCFDEFHSFAGHDESVFSEFVDRSERAVETAEGSDETSRQLGDPADKF